MHTRKKKSYVVYEVENQVPEGPKATGSAGKINGMINHNIKTKAYPEKLAGGKMKINRERFFPTQ